MPWRNLETIVLPRDSLQVLLRWFDGESESEILWIDFFKSCSDFSLEFSRLQVVYSWETGHYKQGSINLSTNSRKSYVSTVLSDSKVTFLGEREDTAFRLFLYCFLSISSNELSKNVVKFPCLPYFRRNFVGVSNFSVLILFGTALKFSFVNCPSLMSGWLLIIFSLGFRRISEQILEIFFPLLKSFFSAGSFSICFQSAFPSVHFIYCQTF